jgi:hypothetical protein
MAGVRFTVKIVTFQFYKSKYGGRYFCFIYGRLTVPFLMSDISNKMLYGFVHFKRHCLTVSRVSVSWFSWFGNILSSHVLCMLQARFAEQGSENNEVQNGTDFAGPGLFWPILLAVCLPSIMGATTWTLRSIFIFVLVVNSALLFWKLIGYEFLLRARDFSMFSVCLSSKNFPSTRCASDTNVVCTDGEVVSRNHIFQFVLRNYWLIKY